MTTYQWTKGKRIGEDQPAPCTSARDPLRQNQVVKVLSGDHRTLWPALYNAALSAGTSARTFLPQINMQASCGEQVVVVGRSAHIEISNVIKR